MKTTAFYEMLLDLGIAVKFLINGLIGGVVWSVYKKSKLIDALRQIFIGGIVSAYATPVIIHYTSLSDEILGFTSFVIGMTGMVILDSIYTKVVEKVKNFKKGITIINK